MPFLLVPVFAQLPSFSLQDRTELRKIVTEGPRYEGQNTPTAKLTFAKARSTLAVSYGASLIVAPLDSASRTLLVFHTVGATASYQLKHTTFAFTDTAAFGKVNFRTAALNNPANGVVPTPTDGGMNGTPMADPTQPTTPTTTPTTPTTTPTTGQPQPGTVQQVRVVDRPVRYVSNIATLNVSHSFSRDVKLNGGAVYSYATGMGADSQRYYPRVRALTLTVSTSHTSRLGRKNTLTLSGAAMDTRSDNGNHANSLVASDTWGHAFSESASSSLGSGLSLSRMHQDSGLTAYTIMPTMVGGLMLSSRVGRGNIALAVNANVAPIPDQLRGTVDPKFGAAGTLTFTQGRFLAALGANGTKSLAPQGNNAGALSGYNGSAICSYQLGKVATLDGGMRFAKQQFQNTTTLPLSYTLFVGLAFGFDWKAKQR